MLQSFSAPGRYIQGENAIQVLGKEIKPFGSRALVLCSRRTRIELESILREILEKERINVFFEEFNGEVTEEEGRRICSYAKNQQVEIIVGIGGGKILDTAKFAAELAGTIVVIVPTSAASDAPCSALSVIYSQDGKFVRIENFKRNPHLVLVDTQIIIKAPEKLFLAGIGDAFATYYEARACRTAMAQNNMGYLGTTSAYALTEICRDTLFGLSEKALKDYRNGQITKELERVVEANIYLSGIGFENNGCAIAHEVYNAMTTLINPFPAYHGICVAYGTLIQLLVEGAGDEWKTVQDFYKKIGLPTKLDDLGVYEKSREFYWELAKRVCEKDGLTKNMPFPVTPEMVLSAIEKEENI